MKPAQTLKEPPVVIALLPLALSYARDILRGIRGFERTTPGWRLKFAEAENVFSEELVTGPVAGTISFLANDNNLAAVQRLGAPTVNVSSRRPVPFPSVLADNREIGKLVARDFLERGLRQFAYLGVPGVMYSDQRCAGFVGALRNAGHECTEFDDLQTAVDQLASMTPPVGVFACTDPLARHFTTLCANKGPQIGQDIALVGVDNDDLLCELNDVPLSSVDPDGRRIGFQAAALLERLMKGAHAPADPILVPPAGLVTRASSDLLAIEEPNVAFAVRYIRQHALGPLSVGQIVSHLPISRRTLEKRFRDLRGHTLHDEIRANRLNRACQLLRQSPLPIPQIAERCGFRDPKRFSTLFHQSTGMPPKRFRDAARVG